MLFEPTRSMLSCVKSFSVASFSRFTYCTSYTFTSCFSAALMEEKTELLSSSDSRLKKLLSPEICISIFSFSSLVIMSLSSSVTSTVGILCNLMILCLGIAFYSSSWSICCLLWESSMTAEMFSLMPVPEL